MFRVPTIAPGLDAWLDQVRFAASGEVLTLFTTLDGSAPRLDPDVEVTLEPSEAWLAAKFRLTPKVGAVPQPFRAMAAAILLPKAFVALRYEGRIFAVAYGAIQHDLLVVESVAVDAATRRRGFARRLVATLMAWARDEGAQAACLQVEADNAPALALYRQLGFDKDLYRYLYRSETR